MGMTLDRITTEEVDGLLLSGSPSYVNQGLRTLRRLLGKAVEWKVIAVAPRIRLLPEPERQQVLDPESESKAGGRWQTASERRLGHHSGHGNAA